MNREFEIEHFGFTADQLSLESKFIKFYLPLFLRILTFKGKHFLQKIVRNALDTLVKKFNAGEKTSELLLVAKEEIFENIWKTVNSENERLNNLDKKYFTIPDHVLLPQYFEHVKSYTEKDEQELDKNLEELKNTFLEVSQSVDFVSWNM